MLAGLVLTAWGQGSGPGAVIRGEILECDLKGAGGELSIRTAGNAVFRFSFDAKTYFERENARIDAMKLEKGDQLEIVSEGMPGSMVRYARTVHVVQRDARRAAVRRYPIHSNRSWLDEIVPMGNLTFSGLVRRLDSDRMVLRTRGQGDQAIMLRDDTRYLQDGLQVVAATLKPNTRVFVRGSRNFEGDVEAYQVVWGSILEPGKRP